MPVQLTRRALLRTSFMLGAGLAIPVGRACEIETGILVIRHPWTRATRPGETTAILCMSFEQVTEPDRLIGAESPVATGAAMGGTAAGPVVDFPIPAGRESALAEDGAYVLLTGLRHPLGLGREYPLQLTFERSGIALAQLSVDFPAAG